MSELMRYGTTKSEKRAEENLACRQIMSELENFGVTQRQRMLLIYLLSLTLEDVGALKVLTTAVKDLAGDELFLATEGADNGKIND